MADESSPEPEAVERLAAQRKAVNRGPQGAGLRSDAPSKYGFTQNEYRAWAEVYHRAGDEEEQRARSVHPQTILTHRKTALIRGIALGATSLTPADVHRGRVEERCASRDIVLNAAWKEHPERFVRGEPVAPRLHSIAYINRPEDSEAA